MARELHLHVRWNSILTGCEVRGKPTKCALLVTYTAMDSIERQNFTNE